MRNGKRIALLEAQCHDLNELVDTINTSLGGRVGKLEERLSKLCPHSIILYEGPSMYMDGYYFFCGACVHGWHYKERELPPRFRNILEACGVLESKKGKKPCAKRKG